jgi:hypothetical protein
MKPWWWTAILSTGHMRSDTYYRIAIIVFLESRVRGIRCRFACYQILSTGRDSPSSLALSDFAQALTSLTLESNPINSYACGGYRLILLGEEEEEEGEGTGERSSDQPLRSF